MNLRRGLHIGLKERRRDLEALRGGRSCLRHLTRVARTYVRWTSRCCGLPAAVAAGHSRAGALARRTRRGGERAEGAGVLGEKADQGRPGKKGKQPTVTTTRVR
jgi:hypothetical protein